MALPFDKKKEGAISVRVEPQVIRRNPDEEHDFDHLEIAAEELMHALKSSDVKGIATALRAAFELMEIEPHQEYHEMMEEEGEE